MFKAIRRKLLIHILNAYKGQRRKGFENSTAQALASAQRQIKRSKYAFLISEGAKYPDARLIEPIFEPETFTFWVGTSPKSRKIAQLANNQHVTLALAHQKDNSNLIVKARAQRVDDLSLRTKHWKPYWRLFFPDGPKGDDYVLIKLNVEEIEVLDFSQSVVPEPFGLKPMRLVRHQNGWQRAEED